MRIDKAIAGSLQQSLSQEMVPTTSQEAIMEDGVAKATSNEKALQKPIPRKNQAKEPSLEYPTMPPSGSLKVLRAPARRGGIRRASQTKIYNLETGE